MAPPRNPAPKPQPKPLPHTVSMSVPDAFLIASGSANGVAAARLEAVAKLIATMAATTTFGIRSDIDFTPFFSGAFSGVGINIPESYAAPSVVVVQIYDRNSTSRLDPSEACALPNSLAQIFRCGRWAATSFSLDRPEPLRNLGRIP